MNPIRKSSSPLSSASSSSLPDQEEEGYRSDTTSTVALTDPDPDPEEGGGREQDEEERNDGGYKGMEAEQLLGHEAMPLKRDLDEDSDLTSEDEGDREDGPQLARATAEADQGASLGGEDDDDGGEEVEGVGDTEEPGSGTSSLGQPWTEGVAPDQAR
jgi:hypothetical protein